MWKDILVLPALPNFASLAQEFSQHAEGFKRMFDSTEPHKEPLPGHWETDLDEFQKMLVLKCIRADKITNAMQVRQEPLLLNGKEIFKMCNRTVTISNRTLWH